MIAKISKEEGNTLILAFEYFKFYYEECDTDSIEILLSRYSLKKLINVDWNFWKKHKAVEIFKNSDWNCTWRVNFWRIPIGIPIEILH